MTEAELQKATIALAQVMGYFCHHTRPARTNEGWRTPLQGNKGFPDLALCGHGRFLLVEFKSKIGQLSEEQREWRTLLEWAGIPYYVLRPTDWHNGEIGRILSWTQDD